MPGHDGAPAFAGPPAPTHAQNTAKSGQAEAGDDSEREKLDELLPLVYEELRRMAHAQLRRERPGHTLSTTDLVHDAYVRLADQNGVAREAGPAFFAIAAIAMRRVLIEYARRHQAAKRGAGQQPITFDESAIAAADSSETLLALDDALTRLAALDKRMAQVVECRYFGGLTEEETARALDITARTVRRDWVKAKAWLYRALHDAER
jgi:RNA polymerase sigma factor (TIGR02999 family)